MSLTLRLSGLGDAVRLRLIRLSAAPLVPLSVTLACRGSGIVAHQTWVVANEFIATSR